MPGDLSTGEESERPSSEVYLQASGGLGCTVRGRVRFSGGAPPWPPVKVELHGDMKTLASAVLVANDRFEFVDVVAGLPMTLDITAEGRRWWRRSFLLEPGEIEEVDATLEPDEPDPPQRLDGLVTDARGRPLAGAVVRIDAHEPVETDLAGRFSIVRGSDQCMLRVTHPDHPGAMKWVCRPGGDVGPVHVRLEDGWAIAIRAVDQTGAPLSGLEVSCTAGTTALHGLDVRAEGATDERGEMLLSPLVGDRWTCRTYRAGYESPRPQSVSIGPDQQRASIHFVLTRWQPAEGGYSIRGRVIGGDGELLTGFRVSAESGAHWVQAASIDADGRFAIDRLPAERFAVTASADEHTSTTIQDVAAGTHDLVIDVHPPGKLSLRVVDDATGTPVVGASVHGYGNTDADGRFLFEWLPREPVKLRIWATGYAETYAGPYHGPPGETVDGGVVRLTRGGVVRGRVVDAAGRPRAGVWVWACPGNVSFYVCEQLIHQKTISRRSGEFEIQGLTPRRWHVRTFDDESDTRAGQFVEVVEGTPNEPIQLTLSAAEWSFRNHDDADDVLVEE